MLVEVLPDQAAMSERGAQIVAAQIRAKPDCVIGFATGGTPLGVYRRLIELHRSEGLDFSNVTTFNLDEYVGLPPDHEQSYHHFMWNNLFSHVNVEPSRVHIPLGTADDVDAFCFWYEEQIEGAGGLDLQILGIGANGHLAFNEPGSSLGSRTRVKPITERTVHENARFFDNEEDVPRSAITMGIGTIMDARKLLLMANGAGKADAIRATLEGPVTAMVPATIVQLHPHARIVIDEAAASKLRYRHHDGIAEPL
jgi:glucosamine-6-phosphate deaminase